MSASLRRDDLALRRQLEFSKYNADYYDHHYWREDYGTSNRPGAPVYSDPGHVKRFGFLASLVSSNVAFGTILDAGCGTGGFLQELDPPRGTAAAFDVSMEAARRAVRVPHPVFVASAHEIPLRDDAFDLVFCSDVLEHLLPEDAENGVWELLRVAQRHIVATINLDNPYEYHPTIWSRSRWTQLFKQAGAWHNRELQERLQAQTRPRYPEYEFFVFSKRR